MATQLTFETLLKPIEMEPAQGGVEDTFTDGDDQEERLITVEWPVRAQVGVPVGRWVWDGDRIVAEYTREELELALLLAGKEDAAAMVLLKVG